VHLCEQAPTHRTLMASQHDRLRSVGRTVYQRRRLYPPHSLPYPHHEMLLSSWHPLACHCCLTSAHTHNGKPSRVREWLSGKHYSAICKKTQVKIAAVPAVIKFGNIVCLKKSTLYFCDYSVECRPILIIFGSVADEKICNRMTYSFL